MSNDRAALRHTYLGAGDLERWDRTSSDAVLGLAGFDAPPPDLGRIPVASSGTPLLAETQVILERWAVEGGTVGEALRQGTVARLGTVQFRECDDFLFGCVAIDERSLGAPPGTDADPLHIATELAYGDILTLLASRDRHLIRVWNYLADINEWGEGDERYRRFNRARRAAFERFGFATEGMVPAASALGTRSGTPLAIHFLAGRRAPIALENPRQLSAYHYPVQYGSHRPIFARACMLDESSGTSLFISGTASIVGHETRHAGDVAAQTRESLANVEVLIDEANRLSGSRRYEIDGLRLKVYVRRPRDLPLIQRCISAHVGAGTPPLYVQADVCRRELLVEIEATGDASA